MTAQTVVLEMPPIVIGVVLPQCIVDELIKTAQRQAWSDDPDLMYCIHDYSGGQEDDAYYGGHTDGLIEAARDLLDKLGIEWET